MLIRELPQHGITWSLLALSRLPAAPSVPLPACRERPAATARTDWVASAWRPPRSSALAVSATASEPMGAWPNLTRERPLQPRTRNGSQQRGPCPLHGSTSATSRCFSVNLRDQIFHCFKCGRSGNALDLWAHATQQTPYDAALDLCQRLSIPLPTLPSTQRNREEEPVVRGSTTCTMETT
jgi:hypothetical protein